MRLEFDLNNNVEMPEIILGKRNYDKLGSIVNIDNLTYEYNLMSADSVSFTVHKELNYEKEPLWNEIKERRLIWLKEFDEWFQIDVVINDETGITKEVTGTSLCEAELGQILLKSTEINTEDDIAREAYTNPTVFYKPSNPDESLLHRLLKAVPNYSIKYVDESLYNIQRTFSIDNTSIYDELTGEIAEEIGCFFLFDSTDRSISVYDLMTNCNSCGYRADYTDICPECGSRDLDYGYGYDTTIFVDSETLAENISLSGNQDSVKNYIKVSGGDDVINAAISACNPTGSQYIYAFSDKDKEDMSDALVSRLDEYAVEYERLTPAYQSVMKNIYDTLDKQLNLESVMMPDIEMAETNAKKELEKLTASNLNPIAVADVSIASVYTVNNAVLSMAKCLVNSTVYKIEFIDGSTSFTSQTWRGKFRITNYSDENDIAENTEYITLTINDDYAYYVEQKIRKTIDRDDVYLVNIFDAKTDLNVFKTELKKYCLNRLNSFESAYQAVIDVLIEANCSNNSIYGDIYSDLYLPYYNKLTAIQAEIKIRIAQIEEVDFRLSELEKEQAKITEYLNLESFLGYELWKELCSFRREDSFENGNYISDGLNNGELFKKAQELLEKAKIDAITASTLQMSLSTTMFNLLAIPEFKKLTGMFEGGNWIRVRVDDKIYRLRLIHYKIDFSKIQNIEVEFSDVTQTANGLNDTKSLMDKVSSMATNFNYVAHQAKQGSKSFTELNTIRNNGLNTALYNISTSINQDLIIDEHGITGRQWDDIIGDYSSEQVKFTNNCLVYTNDYWQTAKAALGKIQYYNPILKERKEKYGLLADAVIAGILMGDDIIGGNIYSENYSSTAGTYIDLKNGNFSFAGGKLTYNSTSNELNLTGIINAKEGGTIAGFTISDTSIYNKTDSLTSTSIGIYLGADGIRQYKSSDAYVTIADGILTANGAVIDGTITSNDIKVTGGTIGGWTIKNTSLMGGSIVLSSDGSISGGSTYEWSISTDGIANFNNLIAKGANINGKITATDGSIGGWTIGTSSLTGGNIVLNSNGSISGGSTYKWSISTDGTASFNKLTAKGADISGKITATTGTLDDVIATNLTVNSGTIKLGDATLNANGITVTGTGSSSIAGWSILNNKIAKLNTNNPIPVSVGISCDYGNYAFWAGGQDGNGNPSISGTNSGAGIYSDTFNPAFAVSQDGKLKARIAQIETGQIGNWTIKEDGSLSGSGGENAIRLFPKGYKYNGRTYYLVIYDDGGGVPLGGLTSDGWRGI